MKETCRAADAADFEATMEWCAYVLGDTNDGWNERYSEQRDDLQDRQEKQVTDEANQRCGRADEISYERDNGCAVIWGSD